MALITKAIEAKASRGQKNRFGPVVTPASLAVWFDVELFIAKVADSQQTGHQTDAEDEIGIVLRRVLHKAEGRKSDVDRQRQPDHQKGHVREDPDPLPDGHDHPLCCCRITHLRRQAMTGAN